jgi:hypothetical protein
MMHSVDPAQGDPPPHAREHTATSDESCVGSPLVFRAPATLSINLTTVGDCDI